MQDYSTDKEPINAPNFKKDEQSNIPAIHQ